ncbi:MAG: transporter substrate-binding domain-containing protein [Lentimicrobium sp.]|nr:transporter substrate-binding domain-containing protein [Lentimicrobium sp.]
MFYRFIKRFNVSILFLLFIIAPGTFRVSNQINYPGVDERGGILSDIQKRGKLIAITDDNPFNYFTYKGEDKGYQYEMLKSFASHLGVELELIIEPNPHKAFQYLRQSHVDIVAMELPASAGIRKGIAFTDPLFESAQVLVQRKPNNWRRMPDMKSVDKLLVRNLADLNDKVISLPTQKQKQFYLSDIQHATSNRLDINSFDEANITDLIQAVENNDVDYTIAFRHTAEAMAQIYPNLDINTPVSPEMGISWTVHKSAGNLMQEINQWIGGHKDGKEFSAVYSRYYKNPRLARLALGHAVRAQNISEYDEIIRQSAMQYNWDWRLIAALIYKESKFQPDVVSHRGAFGLMQLMPKTANHYGADVNSTPAEQIAAGLKLIQYLDKHFSKSVSDPEERIKFVLAAYNIGFAHIIDAQKLAEKYGKDPAIWYDNVEFYMLAKSKPEFYNDPVVKYGRVKGIETKQFVRDVLEKYDHYRTLASR